MLTCDLEEMMLIQWIEVRETNCYLLRGDKGSVLVDPGLPGVAASLIVQVERAGVQPGDITLILTTHGHLDHYGAAAAVKAWCGAPVAAHRMSPEFSRNRRNALPPAQTVRGSLVRWLYLLFSPLVRFSPLEADLALDEDTDLSAYGVEARTVALPGHSPDSLGLITSDGAPRMVYVGHGRPFPGDKLKHIYPARYQLRWWVR
jgi:glyoxylase-like metal-dependent hydrolase (beta-lactamase superfamily II)